MMKTMNKPMLTTFAMIFAITLVVGCTSPPPRNVNNTGALNKPVLTTGKYASLNGLSMYYEVHGTGSPLVLLHGGISTIDSSFGAVLQSLAKTRQVIAVEQQAHGHTADIDRPLTFEQMADDTAALLQQLNIKQADFFGYSDGGNVALGIAIRHPALVRKLVVAGTNFNNEGLYPEILEGFKQVKAEDMPAEFRDIYTKVAPRPEDWPTLVAKVMTQALEFKGWKSEDIQAIKAPTMIMIGDSDIVRPEHAVQMFRLRGSGMAGDLSGLPNSQLAVLPGTTHVALVERAELLLSIILPFLDMPVPKAK